MPSPAWFHSKKLDSTYARCKYCSGLIKHSGNTSNVKKHLDTNHPTIPWNVNPTTPPPGPSPASSTSTKPVVTNNTTSKTSKKHRIGVESESEDSDIDGDVLPVNNENEVSVMKCFQ